MICALELYKYFGAQDPLRFGSRMHKARRESTYYLGFALAGLAGGCHSEADRERTQPTASLQPHHAPAHQKLGRHLGLGFEADEPSGHSTHRGALVGAHVLPRGREGLPAGQPPLDSLGLAILRPTRVDAADSLTNSQLRCWWNAGPAHAPSVPSAADLPMNMVPSHDYKRGVVLMTAPAGPKALRVGMSPVTEVARRDIPEAQRGRQRTRAGGLMRTRANHRTKTREKIGQERAVGRERPRRMPRARTR